MKKEELCTSKLYLAKVIGQPTLQKIKIISLLSNTATVELLADGNYGVAKLADIQPLTD
jgi:hypothetical protein